MKKDHIPTWLAQEQEVKANLAQGSGPGVARPDQVAGLAGLHAMLRGELPYASIA